MTRRKPKDAPARGITPIYEGPEVLGALLARAGSACDVDEVSARFAAAIATGEGRSSVIPTLFEQEPHFPTPDDARRLYANLFGLWGRIAEGRGAHDDAPEVVEEEPPPPELALPDRGSVVGGSPPSDVVEKVWRMLAAAPAREVRRLKDRYGNTQPELGAWLDDQPLSPVSVAPVQELAFETWVIFDQCYGDRLGVASWRELRTMEREPPPLETDHPALAAYVSEQLDNLSDEDATFNAGERAQVERALATVASALASAVTEPS